MWAEVLAASEDSRAVSDIRLARDRLDALEAALDDLVATDRAPHGVRVGVRDRRRVRVTGGQHLRLGFGLHGEL